MIGVTRVCPLFSKLIDRLAPVSTEMALAFKNAGVHAVGRYLENLSPSERDGIFAAGLGILPLSEAPAGSLSAEIGHGRAQRTLDRAHILDVPVGAHVMIDLEAQHGPHADAVAYDEALSGDLARVGYIPLAYIGAAQTLSGSELYALPDVHLYWRGGSLGIPEPGCGFAIWQIPPLEQSVANAVVDVSMTGADLRGRRPILWYPS